MAAAMAVAWFRLYGMVHGVVYNMVYRRGVYRVVCIDCEYRV